ncbi:MAG TPA: ROK family protein, partial [Beutenbergiaceae bacterium]|nr:ROK family protein [Beutenbergiaceae bacterium]
HLATEAELNAVPHKDVRNFVLIRLGGSLGVGVVVNGKVIHGSNGQAGLSVPYVGLSASSITDSATTAELGALSAREVFARARGEHAPSDQAPALAIVHAVAEGLAPVVRWVSQLLDPELIVFGGGIGANTDLLVPALTQALAPSDPSSFPPFARTYAGTDPVLTGAALLTSHHMRQAAFDDVASKPRVT